MVTNLNFNFDRKSIYYIFFILNLNIKKNKFKINKKKQKIHFLNLKIVHHLFKHCYYFQWFRLLFILIFFFFIKIKKIYYH